MADLLHTPLANRLLYLTFATTGFLATVPSSQSTLRTHLTRAMPFLRKCFGLLAHTLAPGKSPFKVETEAACCSCCCLLLEGKKGYGSGGTSLSSSRSSSVSARSNPADRLLTFPFHLSRSRYTRCCRVPR